jgi:tetratricopeptide (TPR) repeat protein
VGLAVLTLLADLADDEPVLCLIDDAHWLDQASADVLLFVARRLQVEGVVMIFSVRESYAPTFDAPGLPELYVARLEKPDAATLLAEHAGDLPDHARQHILTEADGNPLALLALADAHVDGLATPAPARRSDARDRVQKIFADRIDTLPLATQTLLLVAAAEGTGDSTIVLHAAGLLGSTVADLEPAEHRRLLLSVDGRLAFGHPAVRTAVYENAPLARRISVHRTLADVLTDPDNADRRAWHRAAAATSPDEDVAAALEKSAERARSRGGHAAVATAYERSAQLSPVPEVRARRLIAAAEAAAAAGQFDRAAGFVDGAGEFTDLAHHIEAVKLKAQLAEARGRAAEAHRTLYTVARSVPPGEAIPLLYRAVNAAWTANDFRQVTQIGTYAATLPGGSRVEALARAAVGTNELDEGQIAEGVGAIKELLGRRTTDRGEAWEDVLFTWLHFIVGDIEIAHDRATELERDCREHGALGTLPQVQLLQAHCLVFLGRFREAKAAAAEALKLAADTGEAQSTLELSVVLAEIAAIEGDEERCRELVAEAIDQDVAPSSIFAATALSLLDLGIGNYDAALSRLEKIQASAKLVGLIGNLPTLVEAAARTGLPERGRKAAELYSRWAAHVEQPWARSVAERCAALVSGDPSGYERALDLASFPFERARTELLYGESLRRSLRMTDARVHLRSALETFERLGAHPWAARARAELRATGESRAVRDQAEDLFDSLTPQELQVARLAAQGLTNRQIGAQLFLSPRTVGYHLYKTYPKLGVATRAELGQFPQLRDQSDD